MLYSKKEAVIEYLRALSIHGLPFFDVYYRYTEPPDARPEQARVQGEMVSPGLVAGDRVLVEKVAHTVMRVEKL